MPKSFKTFLLKQQQQQQQQPKNNIILPIQTQELISKHQQISKRNVK